LFYENSIIFGECSDTAVKQYEMKENCIKKNVVILAKYYLQECLLPSGPQNFHLYQTSWDGP